jgi:hypothetical protein
MTHCIDTCATFPEYVIDHDAQQPHAAIWITINCTRPTAAPVLRRVIVRCRLGVQSLMRDVGRHCVSRGFQTLKGKRDLLV